MADEKLGAVALKISAAALLLRKIRARSVQGLALVVKFIYATK